MSNDSHHHENYKFNFFKLIKLNQVSESKLLTPKLGLRVVESKLACVSAHFRPVENMESQGSALLGSR